MSIMRSTFLSDSKTFVIEAEPDLIAAIEHVAVIIGGEKNSESLHKIHFANSSDFSRLESVWKVLTH